MTDTKHFNLPSNYDLEKSIEALSEHLDNDLEEALTVSLSNFCDEDFSSEEDDVISPLEEALNLEKSHALHTAIEELQATHTAMCIRANVEFCNKLKALIEANSSQSE